MVSVPRLIRPLVEKWLFQGKIIILYGARQVGKTTFVRELIKDIKHVYWSADQDRIQSIMDARDPDKLMYHIGETRVLVIDEAQMITDIGLKLKILHDAFPDLQIIATGSSSFELANHIKEPLTGRTITFTLFPLSYAELAQAGNALTVRSHLEGYLTTGMYPGVVLQKDGAQAQALISEITSSYVYKDILQFDDIRKSDKLVKLMKLLAFQIGQEVSLHELATKLEVSRDLIDRYLTILEQSFIIKRLTPLSRNLRNEIGKKHKIYFYDIGVRNALIEGFQPFEYRADKGHIWENWLIMERLKKHTNSGRTPSLYFWRTHTGEEIDLVEEIDGKISAFEVKWQAQKVKPPKHFLESYSGATWKFISSSEFEEFIE